MSILNKNDWAKLIELTRKEYERARAEKRDHLSQRSLWLRLSTYCSENGLLITHKASLVPFGGENGKVAAKRKTSRSPGEDKEAGGEGLCPVQDPGGPRDNGIPTGSATENTETGSTEAEGGRAGCPV